MSVSRSAERYRFMLQDRRERDGRAGLVVDVEALFSFTFAYLGLG